MSEKLVIQGNRPLSGKVSISGAKNSVLKLMAASVLTDEPVTLTNVPNLTDVDVMCKLMRLLGREVTHVDDRVEISGGVLTNFEAPYELVSKMRASFLLLGALLGRYRKADVSLPGGCSIGKRGVDLHIKGLQALGADIQIEHGMVYARAESLTGGKVMLDTPSVGATENVLLAAVLAEGSTIISNAAQEPEIVDLVNFLNHLGADIEGAGTSELIINGKAPGSLTGADYHVIPDRIEAATFILAAVATKGRVVVERCIPSQLDSLTTKLEAMGVTIETPTPNSIEVISGDTLLAQDITTQPYPGFPTDLQAPMMAILATAEGVSIVTETIYENRFKQVGELKRMGAEIQPKGDVAVVTGVKELSGAPVKAHDLRAGAAMVIAGLGAHGQTEIYNLHHIDRGYEYLVEKLTGLGAAIKRIPYDEKELEQVAELA